MGKINVLCIFGNAYTVTAICENVLNGNTMGNIGLKYIENEYDMNDGTVILPLKTKIQGCMYVIVNFKTKVALYVVMRIMANQ